MSGRLTNRELELLENISACAGGIIQKKKALSFWLDDPDQLALALGILRDAQSIRTQAISETKRRKSGG